MCCILPLHESRKTGLRPPSVGGSAAAADPLAGSAEWDPNTVTPDETNLGGKLTGKVEFTFAEGSRWHSPDL